MKTKLAIGAGMVALLLGFSTAEAQWLNYPSPGIPRLPDGSPNLEAPVPRTADGTPDLSGIWLPTTARYLFNLAADTEVRMEPWADELYREHQANEGRDRPSAGCLPHSVTDFDSHPTPRKVIQTPDQIVMLFDAYHSYRQILTDGRPLPDEREPAWFGYSVGRWEDDTLVVDTVGVHEGTWLDDNGHPHSDALHLIERFHRVDFGHMEVEITIDDPKTYAEEWTVSLDWEFLPDTELLDWVCVNNRYLELMPN